MSEISEVRAREILDSRGNPTVEVEVALEDGTVFRGRAHGAHIVRTGEVVFNTSMTGYQEVFTDPSYTGQIVVLTNPQVGLPARRHAGCVTYNLTPQSLKKDSYLRISAIILLIPAITVFRRM